MVLCGLIALAVIAGLACAHVIRSSRRLTAGVSSLLMSERHRAGG
jgi:hypothetical protein